MAGVISHRPLRQADSLKLLLSLSGHVHQSECETSRGLIGPTRRRAPQNQRSGNAYRKVRGRKRERGESVFGMLSLLCLLFCSYLMRSSLSPSVLLSPLILLPSPSISKALLLISRSPFFSVSSPSAPAFDSSGARHASGLPEPDRGDFFSPSLPLVSHCLSFPFHFLPLIKSSPTPYRSSFPPFYRLTHRDISLPWASLADGQPF